MMMQASWRIKSSTLLLLVISLILVNLISVSEGIQCWQCASVDNKKCPENAKLIDSSAHDSCITWRLGNGTVILLNVVNFEDECTSSKIDFWSRFINLYYESTGAQVRCCDTDACNTGAFTDDFFVTSGNDNKDDSNSSESNDIEMNGTNVNAIPGAGSLPSFGSVSSPPTLLSPQTPTNLMGANNLALSNGILSQLLLGNPTSQFTTSQPQLTPQQLVAQLQQQQLLNTQLQALRAASMLQQSQAVAPQTGAIQQASALGSTVGLSGFQTNAQEDNSANGNCERYFQKTGNGEWLPNTLIPLSFDRASEMKIGVFYARFTTLNNNNDHLIVRLIDDDKSNRTMYTFKLYRVGSVSLFVSRITQNNQRNQGRQEQRQTSVNNAINITDTNFYSGFWFTVNGPEISFGRIGDRLIHPLLIWNDTERIGPRNVTYFALTTDQSHASFGINCDVPDLHFEDTCVTDDDCEDFPNTVCSNAPVNTGLDPGTRKIPFDDWEERDTMLKSCFCREGHVRIPQSKGCYDPIRQVVTLKDACFADYHCESLPNTHCVEDEEIPMYNHSCQCMPGNKPFERAPRTGLIEGCAPLTEADKASILGCTDRITVEDNFEWRPNDLHRLKHDEELNADFEVIYVKLEKSVRSRNDVAIIRLLDRNGSARKMYSVKFYRSNGKIAISESTRSRGFFFENERDAERVAISDLDLMTRMQLDYVGFWIQYIYDSNVGGTLSVGLNGAPFSSDYALITWTDTSNNAIRNLEFIGFTGNSGSTVHYGFNCLLLDSEASVETGSAFAQGSAQSVISDRISGNPSVVPANAAGALPSNDATAGSATNVPGTSNGFTGLSSQSINGLQLLQGQNMNTRLQSLQNLQAMQAALAAGGLDQASLAALAQASLIQNSNPFITNLNSATALSRSDDGGAELSLDHEAQDETAEPEQEKQIIIEPVLRNGYLTKIKRLLPTFFDEYKEGEVEAAMRSSEAIEVLKELSQRSSYDSEEAESKRK